MAKAGRTARGLAIGWDVNEDQYRTNTPIAQWSRLRPDARLPRTRRDWDVARTSPVSLAEAGTSSQSDTMGK